MKNKLVPGILFGLALGVGIFNKCNDSYNHRDLSNTELVEKAQVQKLEEKIKEPEEQKINSLDEIFVNDAIPQINSFVSKVNMPGNPRIYFPIDKVEASNGISNLKLKQDGESYTARFVAYETNRIGFYSMVNKDGTKFSGVNYTGLCGTENGRPVNLDQIISNPKENKEEIAYLINEGRNSLPVENISESAKKLFSVLRGKGELNYDLESAKQIKIGTNNLPIYTFMFSDPNYQSKNPGNLIRPETIIFLQSEREGLKVIQYSRNDMIFELTK